MSNTTMQTTTQTPSGFGMPACGHAFAPAFVAGAAWYGATRVPSEGQMSLLDGKGRSERIATDVKAAGTSAWRPPTE